MIVKLLKYACIAWTAYLVIAFVYGFLKGLIKSLIKNMKNNRHV